ncbi:MAG: hypothetical protein ACOZIN_20240 [Myxococcota bacterium]
MNRLGLLASLFFFAAAGAQTFSAQREIELVRAQFDAGNYRQALDRAKNALSSMNFTDEQRLEMNKLAGLAAFNLGETAGADEHLYKVLQLNPDYVLDPFAVPPSTIGHFEDLKRKNADALNLVRQQIALREEQARREAAEREEAKRREEEEQRRRLEQLARQATVKTVERRSFLVSFVPFGAGQFQQGRTGKGVLLATTEGALAAISVLSYLVIDSLRKCDDVISMGHLPTTDYPDGNIAIRVCRTPQNRLGEKTTWSLVKYASGAAFYTVYAYGVVDSIYHHQDEVVTEHFVPLAAPVSAPNGAQPFLFPTPGGLGAGFRLNF